MKPEAYSFGQPAGPSSLGSVTVACCAAGIHVGAGDPNYDPHICLAELPTEHFAPAVTRALFLLTVLVHKSRSLVLVLGLFLYSLQRFNLVFLCLLLF